MITDSAFAGQTKVNKDTSSKNGSPSIENYIKKIYQEGGPENEISGDAVRRTI